VEKIELLIWSELAMSVGGVACLFSSMIRLVLGHRRLTPQLACILLACELSEEMCIIPNKPAHAKSDVVAGRLFVMILS
jgi:hypothetical protein